MVVYYKNYKGEMDCYPSLYDAFKLGDRVKRYCIDKNGNINEYKGIVMEINDEYLMIFWDVLDSKYRPKKIDVNFTNCYINEVFDGDIGYTPLRKDRYNLRYIFKR